MLRVTTLPPSCAHCHEIWEPQLPGTLRACAGLYRDCITLPCDYHKPSATGWNPLVTLLPHRNHLISDNRQVTEMISVHACKFWMVSASRAAVALTRLFRKRGAQSPVFVHTQDQSQVISCEMCNGSGTGALFSLWFFGFRLTIIIWLLLYTRYSQTVLREASPNAPQREWKEK